MESPYYFQNLQPQTPLTLIIMDVSISSDGMGRMASAPSGSAPESMPAHCVAIRPTTLNPAQPYSSFLPIVTSFVANAWERALRCANVFEEFSDVPYSICHGFDLGIHSTPAHTYIPPNHISYPTLTRN